VTKKYVSLLLVIMLPTLLLTGCWDYHDINMTNISISTGVDIVNGQIEYTGEVAKIAPAQAKGNENGGGGIGVYNFYAYGKDLEQARAAFDAGVPYPHFLGAARAVIFSTSYAKQSIAPYLHRIAQINDYRKTILPVISRDHPAELFKLKVESDISVAFLIEDMMSSLTKQGKAIYPTVGHLLSDDDIKTIGELIPYVGIEEGSIKYLGLAVLKNLKMVGTINLKDTSGVVYLLAKKPSITENLPGIENKNNTFSLLTSLKKRTFNTDYVDGKLIINIDMNFDATLNYQYYTESTDEKKLKVLEDLVAQSIQGKIIKIIAMSQKEFDCDFIGFAKYFRAQHPLIYRKINWEESYRNADFFVNIQVNIHNLNLADPNARTLYFK